MIGILLTIYRIIFTQNIVFGELSNLPNRYETFIWTIVFIIIDVSIIFSKIKKKSCFTLAFPFKNGRFLVVDGGDGKQSFFTNYHYYGWKSKKVYSPVEGEVVNVTVNDEDNKYWLRKGIPIIFNNRYPVKNCLINA